MIDYSKVPVDYMREGIENYLEHGVMPGGFLTALLSNELMESFARADENNIRAMSQWVMFVFSEIPMNARGSLEQMESWCKHRQRIQAFREKDQE